MKISIALLILSLSYAGSCFSEPAPSIIYSFTSEDGILYNESNLISRDKGASFYTINEFGIYKIDTVSQTLSILQKPSDYRFRGGLTLSQDKQFIYARETTLAHDAVFKLSVDGLHKQSLHEFDAKQRFEEGYEPIGTLITTKDDHTLYGATRSGGNKCPVTRGWLDGGVIYQITTEDALHPKYKVLYAFPAKENCEAPNGELVLSPDEHFLYGLTTDANNTSFCKGTLFRINLKSENPVFESLHSFDCMQEDQHKLNTLVLSKDGNTLYASTGSGNDGGTILKIEVDKPNYPITLLHKFNRYEDGQNPDKLVLSQDGNTLYGISKGRFEKHRSFKSSIFKLSLNESQSHLSVLYLFNSGSDSPSGPKSILLNEDENTLYCLTNGGGKYRYGTVFRFKENK